MTHNGTEKKEISCFQMMVDVRIPSGLSKYFQVFTKIISLVSSFVHHFNLISLCYSVYCIYRFSSTFDRFSPSVSEV